MIENKFIQGLIVHILLFLILIICPSLNALILESLITQNALEQIFSQKKVGYFVGSFDPLHKAHEIVAQAAIDLQLCDYVLIYPSWGGDQYKIRSNIEIRLDMLFAVFADHPNIIVTRLTPQKLQQTLTIIDTNTTMNDVIIRKPAWPRTSFVGIIGSDTALYLAPNPETSMYYMTGLEIPSHYATHTWGSCMALPAESFIIALRNNDDISHLNGRLRERPICGILSLDEGKEISSTLIKQIIQKNESIQELVSGAVWELIERKGLYR